MPLETLKRSLAKWPTSQDADPAQALFDLRDEISSDFDHASLVNVPGGRWAVVSKPLVTASRALFLVYSAESDAPNLATMVRERGEWRLQSLKFQCPGCFGTGELTGSSREENQPCYLCDATGWGAS